MDLVKVTFELRFSQPMELFPAGAALKSALLGEREGARNTSTPLNYRIEDKANKRIAVVNSQQIIMDVEQPASVRTAKNSIRIVANSVEQQFDIPSIARWGIRTTWISKYEGSFQALRDKFSERFLVANELTSEAADVGISLTYRIGQRRATLSAGPMELDQLKSQVLTIPPIDLPDVFTYADVDLGDSSTHEFSEKYLLAFFDEAAKQGKILTESVQSILEMQR